MNQISIYLVYVRIHDLNFFKSFVFSNIRTNHTGCYNDSGNKKHYRKHKLLLSSDLNKLASELQQLLQV